LEPNHLHSPKLGAFSVYVYYILNLSFHFGYL
jgi:hypothetical protein